VVRVAVGVGVGDGDGVGVDVGVAVGDELPDVGDEDGEPDGEAAAGDSTGPGAPPPWPLGVLLCLVGVVLGWGVDAEPGGAWLPEPLVIPGSPAWLEGPVLGTLEFA